jgi:hypothetical protein
MNIIIIRNEKQHGTGMLYAPPANLHMMLATFMIQAVYNGLKFMNNILQGDVIEKLKEIETGTVQCVVTSPPYW